MRLTDEQVVSIRQRCAAGEPAAELAREFGVTKQAISLIIRGESHAGAGGPLSRRPPPRKLPAGQVVAIRERVVAGERRAALAREYGVSPSTISEIATGKHHRREGGPRMPSRGFHSKLAAEQVIQIRERVAAGASQGALARELGVSRSCIAHIANGLSQAAIGGPLTRRAPTRRLSVEVVTEIRRRGVAGESQSALARAFGISQQHVGAILRGRTYSGAGGPLSRYGWDEATGKFRQIPIEGSP